MRSAQLLWLALVLPLLAPSALEAASRKALRTLVGRVTYVDGGGVMVGKQLVGGNGRVGDPGTWKRQLRPLYGSDTLTVRPTGTVQFFLQVGNNRAYCETDPSDGQVRVRPNSKYLIDFIRGTSACGTLPQSQKAMAFGPCKAVDASCTVARATGPADPVFVVHVHKRKIVLQVRKGALVVSSNRFPKKGVVVGRNMQTVAKPNAQPAEPTQAPAPAAAEQKLVTQVQTHLPPLGNATPKAPSIAGPTDPSPSKTAKFTFTAQGTGLAYSCALDGTDFRACANPQTYPSLVPGRHALLVRVTNQAGNTSDVASYSWTIERPASSPIAFESIRGGDFQIYTMNPDGTGQAPVTAGPGQNFDPDWSPDGTKIAFHSDRGGNTDIYVMNANGTSQVRLTTDPAVDRDPTWSPDGKKIAFESFRDDGNRDIYVMDVDGREQTRLTADLGQDFDPHWSPNGEQIAFASERDGNREIYVMHADGTDQTRLTATAATEYNPEWSPDGTKIAFHSDRDGNSEIYVMNADGSGQTRLTQNQAQDFNPTWSPDGSRIAFQSDRDGNNEIYVMNADGSGQTRLTNSLGDDLVPDW